MGHNNGESHKGQFGSNFGFMMAAIGSAVGLGNLWGFPYTGVWQLNLKKIAESFETALFFCQEICFIL